MTRWQDWLDTQAAARRTAGLERALHPRPVVEHLVDLAGNDYLGLSRHPAVRAAAAEAAMTWGAGAASSRLVTGTLDLHAELEHALAVYTGRPAALVLSTGYQANLAAVSSLVDREGFVVSDAHVHASLVDGVRLSRAPYVVTPHNDWRAVDRALADAGDRRALVLVESVYSVLGDEAPLAALAGVCADHDALLVVDEAHAIGVRGAGSVDGAGLGSADFVISTVTLSKALGSQGGAVLGTPAVLDQLVNTARPFIFDTALAPAAAAGALAAVRLLIEESSYASDVASRAAHLASSLATPVPAGAVLSVPMPSPAAALAAQATARERGVLVGCFRPPSTPDGVSRLRVTVNVGITADRWDHAVAVVQQAVEEQR